MTDRPTRRRKGFTAEDVARFRAQYAVAPDEAAAIVGIDRATFYRRIMPHVRGGAIQSMKIGACRRIVVDSLLAFWNRGAA
jgi:hypothetical protein